ncbi:MAG: peptidoglycan DD-metalloendopeptidase family protein, partial [Clostridia bacterium]|nr:peptidoglycan DD-metalloendopeptidase family protein [Clostridia bacterium]
LFEINSSKYMATPDIAKISSAITICTTDVENVVEEVPFNTVKVNDSSKPKGYQYTSVSGINGKNNATYKVYYQNGVEVKRELINSKVVSAPRDQKVVVGTKALTAGPNGTNGGNAKFFWPVARVENSYVSAYWGDGRGHTSVDICAPAGTPIYAGEAGTVVEVVEYSSGYGMYIVIDHGDGYQTLYSHCSAMFVKVGQKVTRGQHIAAIGMTGRATGNHVHFEVRVGGVKVDPAPYLGLYK